MPGPTLQPVALPAPNWAHTNDMQPRLIPARLEWLLDPGSLTRRLSDLANGHFAVHVHHEDWQPLRPDESTMLDVTQDHRGWIREVILTGHGEPWVFARSVAAQRVLPGRDLDLGKVGRRALGELLFRPPGFSRSSLELCQYPPEHLPHELREADLWARRSCFGQADARILVSEVCLPALWTRLNL